MSHIKSHQYKKLTKHLSLPSNLHIWLNTKELICNFFCSILENPVEIMILILSQLIWALKYLNRISQTYTQNWKRNPKTSQHMKRKPTVYPRQEIHKCPQPKHTKLALHAWSPDSISMLSYDWCCCETPQQEQRKQNQLLPSHNWYDVLQLF